MRISHKLKTSHLSKEMNDKNTLDYDPNFFGRRYGRAMKKGSKKAIEEILPRLCFNNENTQDDVSSFIKEQQDAGKKLWVEIGFGNGEHLVELLKNYPDHYFIGCEPFMNGVAHCLKNMDSQLPEEDYLSRVRIWSDSAEGLLDMLPDNAIDRLYLLNPDPWPKSRHHKRRFVREENLDRMARLIKSQGQFITATDVADLAEWMLEKTMAHDAFEWTAKSKSDWHQRPEDWMITTRYAAKGEEEGRTEVYLNFLRI
jgi:tRNA (guanine-N7-)-methyltransferase